MTGRTPTVCARAGRARLAELPGPVALAVALGLVSLLSACGSLGGDDDDAANDDDAVDDDDAADDDDAGDDDDASVTPMCAGW